MTRYRFTVALWSAAIFLGSIARIATAHGL